MIALPEKFRPVTLRDGRKMEVRSGIIPAGADDFWAEWKTGKMKSAGYSVRKTERGWELSQWRTPGGAVSAKSGGTTGIVKTENLEPLPADIEEKLLQFQKISVQRLVAAIKKYGGALDASELGTGKTYCAVAAAKILGLMPMVVCPKAVRPTWYHVCRFFGVEWWGVINYEMLRTGKSRYGNWLDENRKKFLWKIPENCLVIFDEAQKCKSPASQNQKIAQAALDHGYKILGVSGTAASDPTEMKFIGQLTKEFSASGRFYSWLFSNGVIKSRFGLEYRGGPSGLKRIHNRIFPEHGSRIRIADIPDYPESEIRVETFDCDGEKIDSVYAEMFDELERLKQKKFESPGEMMGNVLAVQLHARMEVELLKVPAICEMVEDFLENNQSVVVFSNFAETLNSLCEKLKTDCRICGGQTDLEREKNIGDFQADKKRVIIVNIQSGGAGLSLHDLNGNFPRVAIICPTWSAQDLKQATGRVWRAGSKTKSQQIIFFAANTIEASVCNSLREKLKNIDALNDGDLEPKKIL